MSRKQQTYDQWLRENLIPYSDKNRAFLEIDSILQEYYPHNLKIKADYYQKELLLCIFGSLPLFPPNNNRPCSMEIWIPKRYPMEPPMSFIIPTQTQPLSQTQILTPQNRISVHYEPNMPLAIYVNNLRHHLSNRMIGNTPFQLPPPQQPQQPQQYNSNYSINNSNFPSFSSNKQSNTLSPQFPATGKQTSTPMNNLQSPQSYYSGSSSFGTSPGTSSSSSYQQSSYNDNNNYSNNYSNNYNNNYNNNYSSNNNNIIIEQQEQDQNKMIMERELKEKMEHDELRKSLINKLKSRYKKFNEIIMSDIDNQITSNSTLSQNEISLNRELENSERLHKKIVENFRRLERSANDSLDLITELSFLPITDSSYVLDLNNVITADGAIPKQIMSCLVEDLTIHDLIYSLSKSFLESRCHLHQNHEESSSSSSEEPGKMLTTTNYLRLLRELAREQFIIKATLRKINGIFPIY